MMPRNFIKIKIMTSVSCLVLLTGCQSFYIGAGTLKARETYATFSRSPNHVGVIHFEGKRYAGWVPNKSALSSIGLIARFHNLIWLREYHDAYRIFSDEIKSKLSYEKFLEGLRALDEDYGEEITFTILEDPLTLEFVTHRKPILEYAHDYYDVIFSSYHSQRRDDITFTFGVSRYPDRRLKICFYEYNLPKENKSVKYSALPQKGNVQNSEFIAKTMILME